MFNFPTTAFFYGCRERLHPRRVARLAFERWHLRRLCGGAVFDEVFFYLFNLFFL
jgi:hypothetical protein